MLGGWRRLLVLAAVAGFCLLSPAWSLDPNKSISQYLHQEWGATEGFLGGQVYAISQSGDGYLWIGTERGLVRFDGFGFTLIQRPIPDLPPIGPVRGLITDSAGDLWIRLDGRHLLHYSGGMFKDVFREMSLPFDFVTAMSRDSQGHLILTGLGDQILRFEHGKFEELAASQDLPGTILAIAQSLDGTVWVGSRDDGLYRLSRGRVSRCPGLLAGIKINALLAADNGGMWVGADSGLIFLDNSGHMTTKMPDILEHIEVDAVERDQDGNVWAATDQGLFRIAPNLQVASQAAFGHGAAGVASVFLDRDGDLWYGGATGIDRLRDGVFTAWRTADGIPPKSNGPIYVDGVGRTWFAPQSGGLYWLRSSQIVKLQDEGLDRDVVLSITGNNNEIWIGREHGGLTRISEDGDSLHCRTLTQADGLPQNAAYSLHENRDGTVWAATVSGIAKIKGNQITTVPKPGSFELSAVNSIVEGNNGIMWFATSDGLAELATTNWRRITDTDGLPSSYIQTILEDSKGILWIATSAGIAYLSSGGVKVPEHLPNVLREQILGIAEDGEGDLWFSTSDHVVQVNRDRLLDGSLRETDTQSYGIADGLPGIEGSSRDRTMVSDLQGNIWVSLDQGLAVAHPDAALAGPAASAVRMDFVFIDGKPARFTDNNSIAPGMRSIRFTFSSTNLSDPTRIRFRYKLDGSDRSWSEIVDLHEVIYRNLAPGAYRFHVAASNPTGLWNGPETSVSFVIQEAYWQTYWFRGLCLGLCLLFAAFLYRLRLFRLTLQLNSRFFERLAERTRIAQELHDTLLQGFQGLMLRFQAVNDTVLSDPADAKELMEQALDRADQVLVESRKAIQGIRSSSAAGRDLADSLNAMMNGLVEEFCFGKADPPSTQVTVEGQPKRVASSVSEDACRIAREALWNSFSHAKAHHIESEIAYSDKFLRLRIRDDGIGIAPEILKNRGRAGHWGVTGMYERAKNIHGRLNIWSKPNAGTEVELTIPANVAYDAPSSRGWLGRGKRREQIEHDERL